MGSAWRARLGLYSRPVSYMISSWNVLVNRLWEVCGGSPYPPTHPIVMGPPDLRGMMRYFGLRRDAASERDREVGD